MENHDFDLGHSSILLALWNSQTIMNPAQKKTEYVFWNIFDPPTLKKARHRFWRMKSSIQVNRNLSRIKRKMSKLKTVFWQFSESDFDTRGYGQTCVRMSNWIKIKRTFWEFRTTKIPMQESKKNEFPFDSSPTNVTFGLTSSWTNINLYLPKHMSSKSDMYQN